MTSRDNILAQKSQEPDPHEALRYYQATFNYTENLREVLENLRLRIVWVKASKLHEFSWSKSKLLFAINCLNVKVSNEDVFREIVKNELYAANQQQAFGIAVLLLVLVISPVIIFLVRNATVTIQVFVKQNSTLYRVNILVSIEFLLTKWHKMGCRATEGSCVLLWFALGWQN